jgi:hypothetical protein
MFTLMVRSALLRASRTMRSSSRPSFETALRASSEYDPKSMQHFQALSNHLKMSLFFVMAGLDPQLSGSFFHRQGT